MRRSSMFAALLLPLAATVLPAQGAQPSPADSVRWYTVSYVKFKPGRGDEARRIIYEHFWPVDREVGREVIVFDHTTGEWDHVVYFPLRGGPADLGVAQTPLDRRWREAFVRREGGAEKAAELERRFMDMLLNVKTEIVRRRVP